MVRLIITSLVLAAGFGASGAVFDFALQGQGGAGLLPANEVPPITSGSSATGDAVGSIQYNNSNNQLTFNIPFQNLSSAAQTAAIKGPANQTTGGASVLYDLTSGYLNGAGGTSGSLTSPGIGGTVTLVANPNGVLNYSIAQQEADLNSGLWYIEITSSNFSFGEIRGNLVPVPEPQTCAALTGLALAGFALFRKTRLSQPGKL